MNFWKDGISINESKISILILMFVLTSLFCGYVYIQSGDISNNLTSVLLAQIASIAGVNSINAIASSMDKRAKG